MMDVQRREFENLQGIVAAGYSDQPDVPAASLDICAAILLVAAELRELHILGVTIETRLQEISDAVDTRKV